MRINGAMALTLGSTSTTTTPAKGQGKAGFLISTSHNRPNTPPSIQSSNCTPSIPVIQSHSHLNNTIPLVPVIPPIVQPSDHLNTTQLFPVTPITPVNPINNLLKDNSTMPVSSNSTLSSTRIPPITPLALHNFTLHADRLSVVYTPTPQQLSSLIVNIKTIPGYINNTNTGHGSYNHFASISVKPDGLSRSSTLVIQFDPKNKIKGSSPLRIEYNPSSADMALVVSILDSLFFNAFNLTHVNGFITRTDLACDIQNFNINDYLFYRPRVKTTFSFHGDSLETLYIGNMRSSVSFCIYDKNKEQLVNFKIEPLHPHLTRIEARLRGRFPIDQLHTRLVKALDSLFITPYTTHSDDYYWQKFLDHCQRRGVNKALSGYTTNHQRKLKKWLNLFPLSELLGDRLEIGVGEVVSSVLFPSITAL